MRTPLVAKQWALSLLASRYPDLAAAVTIVTGITQGVDLGYEGQRTTSAVGANLPTAREHSQAIDADMLKQLQLGRRLGPLAASPFAFHKINRMGVVVRQGKPKPRVVHHLSWPRNGDNVNASVRVFDVKLHAFDQAIDALRTCGAGARMAKIDIDAAYRCIPVRPADWPLQGMQWRGKQYYDIVMQFGLASATAIFEWYSSAAEHMAKRLCNVQHLVHYVDDFLLMHAHSRECSELLERILALFKRLGLPVSLAKLEHPSQLMVFLGVLFDTINMTMSLDAERLKAIEAQLAGWKQRATASRAELQSLVGVLLFAAKVVRSGRSFLRRMIDQLKRIPSWAGSATQYPISDAFKLDVLWWSTFMRSWNGKALMPPAPWCSTDPACTEVFTDACTTGWGASWGSRWIAEQWTATEQQQAQRVTRDSMRGRRCTPWSALLQRGASNSVASTSSFAVTVSR